MHKTDPLESISIFGPHVVESWIALCRIIRKTNITADVGPVWRHRIAIPKLLGDYFLLGIGDARKSMKGSAVIVPMDRWEDCYFAMELDLPPNMLFHIAPVIVDNTQEHIAYLKDLFS